MTTRIATSDYNDWKTVLQQFPDKGAIYWNFSSGPGFSASFIADDLRVCIMVYNLAATPPTFNSDFPSAISVSNTVGPVGSGPDIFV